MINNTTKINVILICFLLNCVITNYMTAAENSLDVNDAYLTVQQSLIPMFGKVFSSKAYTDKEFPFNRLNPKAGEYIRFYIQEDNNDREISSAGIWLLGFIGDKEDILFVEKYIDKNVKSSINPENRMNISNSLAANAGWFAGMMFKRNIEGAESFMKKYANISSWMIPSKEDTLENIYTARKLYSYFIMCAYQYSKSPYIAKLLQEKSPDSKPYFHESFVDSYLAINIDKYTELIKPVSITEKKLNENMSKCLQEYGEWIDRLLRKQTYADWRKEQEEQQKSVDAKPVKKPTESFENIDLTNTVEGEKIKAIAIQAVKAYQRLSLTGNEKSILIKDEFLQALKKAGLKNFDDFKVKVEFEAKTGNFVPSSNVIKNNSQTTTSEPNIVIDKINANINFGIQGTADMLKKYAPDTVHKSLLSKKTGDFNVVMIRTNNNWTWAPVVNSPVSADSNIVDEKYLIDCVNKGMIAYRQITQSIIDGNYDPMAIPVLDNNKLIPLKKREKQKDEMTKAIDVEKKILEDLAKAGLNNYSDYNIELKLEATLDNGTLNNETGTMPKTVKGYETADLTFIIPKGADAYKAHISVEFEENSDDKGNLKVSMKRINGTWYWNPFGW